MNSNERAVNPNLKPWKPGQSGNPGGKAKGLSITALLREYLKGVDEPTRKVRAHLVVEKLYELALKGNLKALEYLADRLEGRPFQAIQHSGDAENPPVFVIRHPGREE